MNKQILKIIIFIGLFIVPFIPFLVSSSFFFPFITTKAFAWRIVVEIILAAWVLLAIADKDYRPKNSFIFYAVLGFLAVIGLADLVGTEPIKSFWSNFERMEGYIAMLHLGAYFVVAGSVFKETDWRRWWNTSLVASGLMAFIASWSIFGGELRVDATFGNASYLAVYMLFHIFIATFYLARSWQNVVSRYLYIFLIILNTIVLYHTATRGAILGLLGGAFLIAILGIFNKKDEALRRVGVSTLAVLIIVLGVFFATKNTEFAQTNPVLSRFATLSFEELKTQGRYFVWPMAWNGFKERPILGYGQENFFPIFQKYYSPEMYRLEPWFDRAHNIFLDWLVAGGALGLLSYLMLYLALMVAIVKSASLSHMDKSILYGLIAAYFFHNFFVFDHLVSYILFFSLLAFLHSQTDGQKALDKEFSPNVINYLALPLVIILLVSSLYVVNVKPLSANLSLLNGLASVQGSPPSDPSLAMKSFQSAHAKSVLGRGESVEQMVANSNTLLNSNAPMEERNEFFNFVRGAVIAHADKYPDDARSQIITGSFLAGASSPEEGLVYLNKALSLMPNKQHIYFEVGQTLISAGDVGASLNTFKQAYDLAPEYKEAQIIYLIGAIYAGNTALERELIGIVGKEITDIRIISSYIAIGRRDAAIELLRKLGEENPEHKASADEYIKQIQSGELE